MLSYFIVILLGYLLGSSSMSYYVSKLKKVEIRDKGSKNLGASNTMLVGTIAIAFKHRMNYIRIYNGTEIGLRSANRGDHRA